MWSILLTTSVLALASLTWAGQQPEKIYGVNLGSWLVLESWMLPQEWLDMGGQNCSICANCIASEFAFAQAYPKTVDQTFDKHWQTWFTQTDVNTMKDLGINTVRIPLGYWLVEPLVDRATEYFPRGGMRRLKEGLRMLKDAGIVAILDHHALPGVQTPGQQFTGRCTTDVQFYTTYNYNRALVWTAVMTAFAHMDPDFDSVFAIQAVNEPIMNATLTPGYGTFQRQFVQVVRAVEAALGVPSSLAIGVNINNAMNATGAIGAIANSNSIDPQVSGVLLAAIPVLLKMVTQYSDITYFVGLNENTRTPLTTNFMDVNWQYNNPANPAYAADGPQGYDNHLYYSFGGVAAANPTAYMQSICNLQRIQADKALGNSPLWFGEWGLPTEFYPTDAFLRMWADAQKLMYSQGAGWIFWNFKVEQSTLAGNLSRTWSYFDGVNRGYLTKDPTAYYNPNVCAPYINSTSH